jgi:sugar phosphate isomerase/epimerase
MTLSLSTMWAQQARFDEDMHRFVEEARQLGYDAIEVSHLTPVAQYERLATSPDLRISSIHAPAPLSFDHTARRNSSLNLASPEVDEHRAAIDHTKRSIELARHAGVPFVVVHLGAIGAEMFEEERELRRLYDSGTRGGERVEQLREACHRIRAERIGPWLEQAVRTFEELSEYAEDAGIAIGLENRLHYHEIPQPEECRELLEELPAGVGGYWHDVGHAEVQWRLGLVDKHLWLDTNGERCIGAHLHDVDGIGDHRAPGNGDVDWSYIATGLPPEALRVFEINQTQPAESVAATLPFLRARGVVP